MASVSTAGQPISPLHGAGKDSGYGLPTPDQAKPNGNVLKPSKPGEPFVLSVAVHKDQHGQWRLSYDAETSNLSLFVSEQEVAFFAETGMSFKQSGKDDTVSAVPGEPLELLRLRAAKEVGGGYTLDSEPTQGLVVWIDKQK